MEIRLGAANDRPGKIGGLAMARLANGVRKRADGLLEKRFMVEGKRYSVYGINNKEIEQKERELRKIIEAGSYTSNRKLTLDEYFEEWLVGKRNTTKGNSLKTYKACYYNHISNRLGKKKIQKIERREILRLQNEVSQELSISTCNFVLKVLKIILNDAVNDDIIVKNPASGVKALKEVGSKATETHHRALEEWEQIKFMEQIRNDFYYEFIALLLTTGMRQGEVAALTWSDIDYKQNVIHVTKTVTYDEYGKIKVGDTPKSESGVRDIPMNDTIKEILKSQKKKNAMLQGSNVMQFNNRIFSALYGGIVNSVVINKAIANALAILEEQGIYIERFTAHALRDTFATRYIEQGGNMQTLKTILGHSSLSMTMDLYSHVLPNTKQAEMNSIKISI